MSWYRLIHELLINQVFLEVFSGRMQLILSKKTTTNANTFCSLLVFPPSSCRILPQFVLSMFLQLCRCLNDPWKFKLSFTRGARFQTPGSQMEHFPQRSIQFYFCVRHSWKDVEQINNLCSTLNFDFQKITILTIRLRWFILSRDFALNGDCARGKPLITQPRCNVSPWQPNNKMLLCGGGGTLSAGTESQLLQLKTRNAECSTLISRVAYVQHKISVTKGRLCGVWTPLCHSMFYNVEIKLTNLSVVDLFQANKVEEEWLCDT